jgi:hypothetical protein
MSSREFTSGIVPRNEEERFIAHPGPGRSGQLARAFLRPNSALLGRQPEGTDGRELVPARIEYEGMVHEGMEKIQ